MKLAILLLKKIIVCKEEILSLFLSEIHLLLQVQGTVIRWITSPIFHGVRSVQFDNRYSGHPFMSRLPCSRPKCCLDEKQFISQYTSSRGFSGRQQCSLPCELRTTYLLYGRHPWTSIDLAIFQTPSVIQRYKVVHQGG